MPRRISKLLGRRPDRKQAGGVLVKHYKTLAFMGFVEVVRNLPTIF